MLNRLCNTVIQNKNVLMLISTLVYMLSLVSVITEAVFAYVLLLTLIFIFFVLKNLFPIKYIIVWTILFYIGVFNTSIRVRDTDELLNLTPVNCEITGTIISIPQEISEGKSKFFFDVKEIKFDSVEKELQKEKVLVNINSKVQDTDLKLYNKVKLTGRLSPPFKAGNPSQFDYGNYLRNHDAYAVFYAKSFEKLDTSYSLKAKTLQKISDYRENVIRIHSKYLPSPNLEILGGIVFGDDAVSPPKNIKNSFANSGLLHILAASGMNVAFIYGFFFWLLSLFRVKFKLNVLFGMSMVIVYSLMTGLGASIIRATAMLLFVLIGKLIDRDAHSISLLSFVALLMLLYNPLFINDVGFQLSFIVTFGILIMAPAIMRFNNKILDYIIGTISIPIIAQLWVIPVQIFYFSNISLYSVFANVMSVPILAVLSFGGFISALLSGITPIAEQVCKIFDLVLNPLLSLLINISDFWGHLPHSGIQTTHPSILQMILYYLMLLCISVILYKEFREKYLKRLVIALVILFLSWCITLVPLKNSNLEITTFDVGSADCFLIKTPENKYIMIDTGKIGYNGGKSQAEVIVLKYLQDKGIKDIDSLVVTHFDNDHCGGALDVVKELNVKKIYVNDLDHYSVSAKNLYKIAKSKGTELLLATNNQELYNSKGLVLTNFLGVNSDNDNENSIITLLKYNDFTMLFTGDVGISGIKRVLDFLPQNITVLKVPHHGALGGLDKSIVEYLYPQYSIISVGENKFGHPAQYTLELLGNSRVLRTDVDNSVLITVSKKNYKIKTYDSKRRRYISL